MLTTIQLIFYGITLLIFASIAVFSKSLLRSVISLGVCSFILALFFFLFQANVAAIFEISVGAGLMSVLLIIAISLVDTIRRGERTDANETE